jgi:hypothetical protein
MQGMVKLIIEGYKREVGVRNLERNLASLALAAAVKVAEQVNTLTLGKEIQLITSTLLDSRLADSGEVEMEVIPIGHDISNSYENPSPMIVDEAMCARSNCNRTVKLHSLSVLLTCSVTIKGDEPYLNGSQTNLLVNSLWHVLHIYINGKFVGNE